MLKNKERELKEFTAGIREILATGNPNPKRADCARFTKRIRALAWHVKLYSDLEEVLHHISHCSPCFKDHRRYKTQYKLYRGSRRVAPYFAAVVALFLLVLALQVTWKRPSGSMGASKGTSPSASLRSKDSQVAGVQPRQEIALNLGSNLRGDDRGHPIDFSLPRARFQLTLQLPIGAKPGKYLIRLSQRPGKTLLETDGIASADDTNVLSLRINEVDTSKMIAGKYQLSLKREALDWTDFDVLVK